MERLPLELVNIVFQHLDAPGLKNFRLVNSQLSSQATPYVFHEIRFYACPTGFKKLRDVSNHPLVRNYVRKLTYDTRSLPDFKDEFQWAAAADEAEDYTSCEIDWREPKFEPYKVTRASWANYLELYFARLMGKGEDLTPLKKAFTIFPALRAIQLYNGYDFVDEDRQSFFEEGISEFGPFFRDTCTIPCSEGGYGLLTPRTRSLLAASTLSRSPIQQMRLDVRPDFLNSTKDYKLALQAAQHLTDLSIRIVMPSRLLFMPSTSEAKRKKSSSRISEFIGASRKLKKLQISYRFVGDGHGYLRAGMPPNAKDVKLITELIIARTPKAFKDLKSLTLDGVSTTVEQLLRFMSALGNLEYLQLNGIKFEEGSWLTFLRALPSKIKLTHFALCGVLSGAREMWKAEVDFDPEQDKRSLRRKIEKYAELGGSMRFPLFPNYHPKCYFHHQPSLLQMARFAQYSDYCMNKKNDFSFRWLTLSMWSLPYFQIEKCGEDCPMHDEGQKSESEESEVDFIDPFGFEDGYPLYEDYSDMSDLHSIDPFGFGEGTPVHEDFSDDEFSSGD
jgi:hypothetical protein